jgi:hypothetical protein
MMSELVWWRQDNPFVTIVVKEQCRVGVNLGKKLFIIVVAM